MVEAASGQIILLGVAASFIASLGTAIGSGGALFIDTLSRRLEDGLLSGAAGIMLAATFFSLLLPALESGLLVYGSALAAVGVAIAGLLLGAVLLHLIHARMPHEHFHLGVEGPGNSAVARIWLFVIAITLHNFPEGLAVGVSFSDAEWTSGIPLTAGIAIQNIPEGLAVSVALLSIGYPRGTACGIGAATGLVEPVGGLLGALLVAWIAPLVPWALAGAAGAMLFIISDEIIPETHRGGNANLATFSLIGGFALMMLMDTVLSA